MEGGLQRMRETIWHVGIILLVTGSVFFTNLGESRLWDRDEPRNAGCAAEMMARGDLIVPIFNDELRHQKPILLYWLIISAYSVFGVNEFSARFWSAVLASGTTFATYGIARRLINPTVAVYAAIALASSLMFDVAARAATPDSVLMFCGTTALLLYVIGTFSRSDSVVQLKNDDSWFPRNPLVVTAMYAMLGLGVLAKGPVGFLLPMAIIGLFILVMTLDRPQNNSSDSRFSAVLAGLNSCLRTFHPVHFFKTLLSMRPVMGAAIILLVSAPWYFLVDAQTEGDFTRMFFIGEHFGRATHAMENHNGGFWFYPVAILVGFFPWSILWGPVAIGLINRERGIPERKHDCRTSDVATTLMLCWIAVQVGAFSLAQTKLPSYVTPCYPALAILTATCLVHLANKQSHVNLRWFYVALVALVLTGLVMTLGIGVATTKFLPSLFWLTILGLIPLIGGLAMIWQLANDYCRAIPTVFSISALMFCITLFGFGTVSLDAEQQSDRVLSLIGPEVTVGAYGALESSWVFYGNRPVIELETHSTKNVDGVGLKMPKRERFWKPKPNPTIEAFLDSNPDAMLLTTDEHLEEIKPRLPKDYEVLQSAQYFLKNKQILLLGRRPANFQPTASEQVAKRQSKKPTRR